MESFNERFEKESVDGVCATAFLPINIDLDNHTKEEYICIYLYDAPYSKTACWFFVKKSTLPAKGKIVFKVNECMISKIIGKQGVNVKKIAKALGGRYVTVKSV